MQKGVERVKSVYTLIDVNTGGRITITDVHVHHGTPP